MSGENRWRMEGGGCVSPREEAVRLKAAGVDIIIATGHAGYSPVDLRMAAEVQEVNITEHILWDPIPSRLFIFSLVGLGGRGAQSHFSLYREAT